MNLTQEVRLAAHLVVGNLNEDGYLTATDDELVDALLEARGPARAEPIPFERGIKARLGWEQRLVVEDVSQPAAARPGESEANSADPRVMALATVLEGREVVNHLDPVGV